MTLLQIQAQTTQTAPFNGSGVDVSGISGDWTLKINVSDLHDNVQSTTPLCRFAFSDSVNSFTGSMAGPTISFLGTIAKSFDRVRSFKKQDFPDLRLGTASALLRLQLLNLESGGSVTYRAWVEY